MLGKCIHCISNSCEIPLSQECDGLDKSCTGYVAKVQKPCQGCVYFTNCGDNTRTEVCLGRKTKLIKE